MVRGKKRIGYELEFKLTLEGRGRWEGLQIAYDFKEFCDDGSEEQTLYVQKENMRGGLTGMKFKDEAKSERVHLQVAERVREALGRVRDEV